VSGPCAEFLCNVYLRAHHSMRPQEEMLKWRQIVSTLLDRSAAACQW